MCNIIERLSNIRILPAKLPAKVDFTQGYYKRVNEIPVKAKNNVVFARTEGYGMENWTLVFSRTGKPLGKHNFRYDDETNTLVGGFIRTFDNAKGKGIGEIMRLLSIMNLKENNLSQITLKRTLPEAVPFHAKYKFLPDIKSTGTAEYVLTSITNNFSVEKEFRKTAMELKKLLLASKGDEKQETSLMKTINQFLGIYIDKHSKNWKDTQIDLQLPMVLTKERIKDNAKYFNSLFKKHGIDFEV